MGKNDSVFRHTPLFVFADVVIVNSSVALSFLLRYGPDVWRASAGAATWERFAAPVTIAMLVAFHLCDLYSDWVRRSRTQLLHSISLGILLTWVMMAGVGYCVRTIALPRSVFFGAIVWHFILVSILRVLAQQSTKRRLGKKKVLIVGQDIESAGALAQRFAEHASDWYEVLAFISSSSSHEIEAALSGIDVVLLTSKIQAKSEILRLAIRHGKEVLVTPELFELCMVGSAIQQVDDVLLLSVCPPHLNKTQRLVKRLFDVLGATVAAVLSAPVLLAMSVGVRLSSKGPTLFSQERLGQDRKPYRIQKLRTMVDDAEKLSGPVLASQDDPRLTSFGRFLRATRIDELPQLWNVLKGEMSLVGPRPEREFFVGRFEEELPGYGLRFATKPGITGLAQVMGRYSTTVERKLRFDLLYIYNYSFVLDLKIILRTIWVVLQRESAAGLKEHEGRQLMDRLRCYRPAAAESSPAIVSGSYSLHEPSLNWQPPAQPALDASPEC